MNWTTWTHEQTRREFDFLIEDYAFAACPDVNEPHIDGVRYQLGKCGIEIVREIEYGSKLTVWIRYLTDGRFPIGGTWSRKDVSLDHLCVNAGLEPPREQPKMRDARELERELLPVLENQAVALRRAMSVVLRPPFVEGD